MHVPIGLGSWPDEREPFLLLGRESARPQTPESIVADDEKPPTQAWAPSEDYIAALHREHDGYVQLGLDDRAAEVAEQLKLCGQKPPAKRRRRDADG